MIAFGAKVVAGDVYHEGISAITQTDIDFASRLGYVIKLLAIYERFDDGTVAVRVHPAMVPAEHPLAARAARDNLGQEDAKKSLLMEKQPSLQFVTTEQLAGLALFFCSPAADQVRGVAWNMDGGWFAQ